MTDRKSKSTRQKHERGDRKEQSNDSPGIPDMGVTTSDIPPGSHSGFPD